MELGHFQVALRQGRVMAQLTSSGGSGLAIGSSAATRISDDPAGSLHKTGNFQSYVKGAFSAWMGMWGVFVPANESMTFTIDMRVSPTLFPATTKLAWSVTPDPDYGGINGFLHVDWGNYDDSAGSITPRQAHSITALSASVDWTFAGSNLTGLLCECYLTTASHATGGLTDKVCEVGFLPKCSPSSQSFAAGLPAVGTGSFVDGNGVTWNVGQALDGSGTFPYYVATRVGYVDHPGALDFKAYFAFLQASGKITGNEWFNGLGFGPEPLSGASTLTINSFTPTYS